MSDATTTPKHAKTFSPEGTLTGCICGQYVLPGLPTDTYAVGMHVSRANKREAKLAEEAAAKAAEEAAAAKAANKKAAAAAKRAAKKASDKAEPTEV